MIDNNLELAIKAVPNAYHAIVAELKQMLSSYPEEYRTYIVLKEPNIEGHPDYLFFNPLVTLHLQKADRYYYLDYVRFQGKTEISGRQWLAITRCILNHTSKTATAVDIERFVSESIQRTDGYTMALKEYEAGRTEFQPHSIKSLT